MASRGKLAYKLVPDTLSYKKDPISTSKKDKEPCPSGNKVIETTPPPKLNSPDADNLAEDEDIATTDSKLWDLDWGLDHIDGRSRFFLQYCKWNFKFLL